MTKLEAVGDIRKALLELMVVLVPDNERLVLVLVLPQTLK
jgi:hypothetical protein